MTAEKPERDVAAVVLDLRCLGPHSSMEWIMKVAGSAVAMLESQATRIAELELHIQECRAIERQMEKDGGFATRQRIAELEAALQAYVQTHCLAAGLMGGPICDRCIAASRALSAVPARDQDEGAA